MSALYRVVNPICGVFELFCGVPPWDAGSYRILVYLLYQGPIKFVLENRFLSDQIL